MNRLLLSAALLLCSLPAFAFNMELRTDNAKISEEQLRTMVLAAAEGVRHNIPDSQEVYVYVITRARPRDNDPTKYLYFHRAELRRHFKSGVPYPINGWLPIKSTEFYGVDDANGTTRALENTLRSFFSEVKNLHPDGIR